MSAAPAQTEAAPNLEQRLQTVQVGVRSDLEVSRHVFRGEPCYIIRDPVTFQGHRLTPEDYGLFTRITADRTLGEVCAEAQQEGLLDADDAESFYRFVFALHRLGFLSLPVPDDKLLFQRYETKRRMRLRQKLLGFLFLQIPVINPDAFLGRTLRWTRWLYTSWFLAIWLVLVGAAAYVGVSRYDELLAPLQGLLLTRNLLLMWATLIILKVLHEFGHAYACKHFGGHVPEMGIYLIAFTPCAYVDATAAWGFPSKWHRLAVSLAGMYVETLMAALAVFMWAFTEPSLLHSVAYNVIFLASAVTVLFNVNPLMRYDGYYILSDLLEIPNLRQRASQLVTLAAKRVIVGVRAPLPPGTTAARAALLTFGLATTIYRTLLLISIGAVIATKFFVIGVGLAAIYISGTLFGNVRRLTRYLWFAAETAPVRARAIAVSVLVLGWLPALVGFLPLPRHVHAAACVGAAEEAPVCVSTPGFIAEVAVEPGATVGAGQVLAQLEAPDLAGIRAEAETRLRASQTRHDALVATDPAAAQAEAEKQTYLAAALADAVRRADELRISAPAAGEVVNCLPAQDAGRFLTAGQPVALVASGPPVVRALVTAEELAAIHPQIGQRLAFRATGRPATEIRGWLTRITPLGTRVVGLPALTQLGGGDVVVDPHTGAARQPYFELLVTLDAAAARELRHGMTGVVRLPAAAEPLGMRAYRKVLRFLNWLDRSSQ